jgi:succinate dehydrogenase cytochrome b556 subunit
MDLDFKDRQSVAWIEKVLIRTPLVSRLAALRGAAFVVSWMHRISGGFMLGFAAFHLLTLQTLKTPQAYEARMAAFGHPVLAFLEWALAAPIIYHALNGGRLILFESFGFRREDRMLNAVLGISCAYCSILALTMLSGILHLPVLAFWGPVFAAAVALSFSGARKILQTAHAPAWKVQRLSGLFLLIMVPAHLFFMHMNPVVARDAGTVLSRLQSPLIRFLDLALAAAVIYHGAYGLMSIANDYVAGLKPRRLVAMLVTAIGASLFLLAARLLFL